MEEFNKVALACMEQGLFVHWETEVTDLHETEISTKRSKK